MVFDIQRRRTTIVVNDDAGIINRGLEILTAYGASASDRERAETAAAQAETAASALETALDATSDVFTPTSLAPITLPSATWVVSDVYASGVAQFSPDDWEQVGNQLTLKRSYFIGAEVRYRYRIAEATTQTTVTLPDGSAAVPSLSFTADADTGFARLGANILAMIAGGVERLRATASGIQITGLLSGTAVVQSTTDTTAGRVLTTGAGPDQAFRRGNILGTVSQSGGVPTGAVVQRGSNANGEFVRFADGTQICTFTAPGVDTTSATGALFQHTNALAWTYPIAFATPPVVSGGAGRTDRWLAINAPSSGSVGYRVLAVSSSATTSTPSLTAVGKWF